MALCLLGVALVIVATAILVAVSIHTRKKIAETRVSVMIAAYFNVAYIGLAVYAAVNFDQHRDLYRTLGISGAWLLVLGTILQVLAKLEWKKGELVFKDELARDRLEPLGWTAILTGATAGALSLTLAS